MPGRAPVIHIHVFGLGSQAWSGELDPVEWDHLRAARLSLAIVGQVLLIVRLLVAAGLLLLQLLPGAVVLCVLVAHLALPIGFDDRLVAATENHNLPIEPAEALSISLIHTWWLMAADAGPLAFASLCEHGRGCFRRLVAAVHDDMTLTLISLVLLLFVAFDRSTVRLQAADLRYLLFFLDFFFLSSHARCHVVLLC